MISFRAPGRESMVITHRVVAIRADRDGNRLFTTKGDANNVVDGVPVDDAHVLGVYAFAFQIYGDFAGYSDIARGVSKWMGIELNVNFRFPYLVRTPQEFWQHWHISLSAWLCPTSMK